MELKIRTFIAAALAAVATSALAEVDADAALAMARRENCLKCHAIDKKKDGPAYKKVAEKYRDKPDAEEKLMQHLTSGRVVKLSSGDEEEHRNIKGRPEADIRNLIQWILSQ